MGLSKYCESSLGNAIVPPPVDFREEDEDDDDLDSEDEDVAGSAIRSPRELLDTVNDIVETLLLSWLRLCRLRNPNSDFGDMELARRSFP